MINSDKQEKNDMSIQKAISVLLSLVCFIAILFLPLICMNREKQKVSPLENRVLATFPSITTEGEINKGFVHEFEQWFSDNLGFRFYGAALNANIKVKLFNQPSGTVNIGKEGWYYYSSDNNLQLTNGTYPLTEEHLAELATCQQRIADSYSLRGIDYYYVVNPSKSTVYPEYVYDQSGTRHTVGYSPAERVVDYLTEHTTVKAMTPKTALLKAKDEGQKVFLKTDTHYTHLGAYIAAAATGQFMGIDMPPLVDIAEEQRKGEFSNMLGDPNILPAEAAPVPIVDKTYTYIDQNNAEQFGEFYIKLKEFAAQFTPNGFAVYENLSAPGGTLLVYGDSQVQAGLGHYYYQYYSRVILLQMTSFKSGSLEIEAFVKPNVVLRDLVERYVGSELSIQPDTNNVIPLEMIKNYPDSAEEAKDYYDAHYGGLCIDQPANDGVTLNLSKKNPILEVQGWSFDPYAKRGLNALYIKALNSQLIEVRNKNNEHSGPRLFYEDPMLPTDIGFQVEIPLDVLENPNQLVFVRIGAYSERLPDKVYEINYVE